MKKLTVKKQVELFAQDCKLINLRYEYSGFTGTEKWAIITELSEEALWDKYPDVISRYTPIVFVGGGAVVMKNFGSHDAKNISYNLDVKANARGYEQLATMGLKSTKRLS